MQEPLEGQGNSTENLLDRQTPLTINEISQIRSQQKSINGLDACVYQLGDSMVSLTRKPIWADAFKDEQEEEQIIGVLKRRQDGEVFTFETLLANALIEQLRIARRFDLPVRGLYLHMNLDYLGASQGTQLMNNWGDINMLPLSRHVDNLRKQGATDEQIIIEFAGHMFHEAVHEGEAGLDEALLNGRTALGEVTSVTAQVAYYLDKGYLGPFPYNSSQLQPAIRKVREGTNSSRDYDIATYVACKLLFHSLLEEYPEYIEETRQMNELEGSKYIVNKLSDEQKQKLVPCLKKAIAQSADEEVFKKILEQTKTENPSK